ncbi:hypothetical protein V8E36_007519 [Tilletia maclaganii]
MAPNHFRHDQQEVIRDWAAKAVAAGFAAGPLFPSIVERVMGAVACVPLTVVHTAATPTKPAKDRVCFNASWDPHKAGIMAGIRSINKEVEDEDWECEWFLLTEVKRTLHTGARPGLSPCARRLPSRGQTRRWLSPDPCLGLWDEWEMALARVAVAGTRQGLLSDFGAAGTWSSGGVD